MKRILIFFGGCSTEYPVSLQSAQAVLAHLDRRRFAPLMVGITREGKWLYYTGDLEAIAADRWQQQGNCTPCALIPDRGVKELLLLDGSPTRLPFDAAFPVLHGKNGEDGTLQGLLELAGVPVIGCGSSVQRPVHGQGPLPQAGGPGRGPGARQRRLWPGGIYGRRFRPRPRLWAIRCSSSRCGPAPPSASPGWPAWRQLAGAVSAAFDNDREILLEEAIAGFEVGCAVLGTRKLTAGGGGRDRAVPGLL